MLELNSDTEPYLSGFDNTGYTLSYLGESVSSAMGEIFRPTLIGGDTADGHTFATAQTISLADTVTHAFTATGSFGVGIITNNFDDGSQALFTHDNNSFKEFWTAGSAQTGVTYGTTTEPVATGDLGIWITGGDTINIVNNLGDTRIFHFWHFGGNT